MGSHVLRQMALKVFLANCAVERLHVGMVAGQVLFQRIGAVESFSAQVTGEITFLGRETVSKFTRKTTMLEVLLTSR
jgi:hypothetical protein